MFDKVTGQITKEAIKSDVLGKHEFVDKCGYSSGLSVSRIDSSRALPELQQTIRKIASRPKKDGTLREVVGHATVGVKWLSDEGATVLDDGKLGFASHAVIRTEMTKSQVKKLRHDLVQELNKTLVRW
ncbi:hypothetical protein [Rhizobium sp. RCAM05973]|uniref:hypothetical protein n=1 Tax=Rhizobium sp. RCAM05973 TaxID=2994066 RepID=UPI0022EBDEC5|nr:hypothetical protein [Rhizobium sp. RCAM05973]